MIDANEISIRPAAKEDMVEVCALLRELGLTLPPAHEVEKVKAHINRMWDNNPYYNEFNGPVFYGWVMMHHNDLVGFFGTVPRIYYLKGEKIPVSIASNWGVKKEYRTFTGMLCDAYFNQNPIALKLVTTAIKPTGKIFERYKGKRAPDTMLDSVYMVPYNIGKLVRLKLKSRKFSVLSSLSKLADILPVWKLQYRYKHDTCLQEVDINDLPKDFDSFWQTYLGNTNGFIASHDMATMKWVYGYGKRELVKKVFVYRDATGTISGYASLIDEPIVNDTPLKRYKIGDLLALTPGVKRAMLKALIRHAYDMKADVLEVHVPNTIHKHEIPGFTLKRIVPSFPVFYHSSDDRINVILNEPDNWNLSPYDGDTSLG